MATMKKKATKPCFSNGTEMMLWQERNCMECKKGAFYNEKLKRMAQYRCAVQRDIETQYALGEEQCSLRSWEAAQCEICPYFKPKNEKQAQQEVLNFAVGESIVKQEKTQHAQKKRANMPLFEQETQPEKKEPGFLPPQKPKLSQEETFAMLNEKAQEVYDKELMVCWDDFTEDEIVKLAFSRLVATHIAWVYAFRVVDECRQRKISVFRKFTRAIEKFYNDYREYCRVDMDCKHLENIEMQTEGLMQEHEKDFTIMWFSVNAELKRVHGSLEDKENLLTNAWCSLIAIKVLRKWNKKMNEIVWSRNPNLNGVPVQKHVVGLETMLEEGFLSEMPIEITTNIELCMKILENNLEAIKYDIVK